VQYFIKILDDDKQDLMNEKYLLGEQSFKVFWAGTGFESLQSMIKEAPELLESISVMTDTGIFYSVEEFLDKIKTLQVRTQ
tara:strand:- start:362 stop:604 length:243 start_codon:yes stop_codon:yes gene_type:complete